MLINDHHCVKHAKMRGFSVPRFPEYGQSRRIHIFSYRIHIFLIRESRALVYFT